MQIALIGDLEKIGRLVNIIGSSWDNADVSLFPSVMDFQSKAVMRTIYADRIIILDNTSINTQDMLYTRMGAFKQFLEEDTTYGVTTIVVLCKSNAIADIYANFFNDSRSLVLTFISALKATDVRNFAGETMDVLRDLYKGSITVMGDVPVQVNKPAEQDEKKGIFGGGRNKKQTNEQANTMSVYDVMNNETTFSDDMTQTDFAAQGFYPQFNNTTPFQTPATVSEDSTMQVLDTMFDTVPKPTTNITAQAILTDTDNEDDSENSDFEDFSGSNQNFDVNNTESFTEISFDTLFEENTENQVAQENDPNTFTFDDIDNTFSDVDKGTDETDLEELKYDDTVSTNEDAETDDTITSENNDEDDVDSENDDSTVLDDGVENEDTFDVKHSSLYEGVEQRIDSMSEEEMAALFDD